MDDLPLVQVLAPDGTPVSETAVEVSTSEVLECFGAMLRLRLLDERMLTLQRQGRIGFYGQAIGQEAAVVGSAAALESRDWVVPALREGGVALHRGYPLERLIAQCAAKDSEVSHGRQMPCHYTFAEGNFVSMSSVIGTQIPHATGIARAAQIRGDDVVVMGYLGDGATSSTEFHSALNFAGVWKAPVVFFCQNNQWAISVPFSKQTATRTVAEKGAAYGVPSVRVDGNDVIAVLQETRKAVLECRAGRGPVLIEALTYRREGHSSSDDPTRYRAGAEVEEWIAKDPIERVRRFLRSVNSLDAAQEDRMEQEIQAAISEAIHVAEAAPDPGVETLTSDVYASPTPQLAEQLRELMESLRSRNMP